jgi:formylmethanofuran dehydrogenase subunit C
MSKSALTLTLKKNLTFKVDCSQLTPDKLAGMSLDKILEITLTNNLKVIDLFKVSGDSLEQIVFKKSTSELDFIGHKMLRGHITIEGDCGDFLGANLHGGSIVCTGHAGDRVGDKMRRGLILIDGSAGDYCGSQMIAGTIGVFEKVGKYAGFGMKRGTILLTKLPKLHATIQDCDTHTLPFLTLLFASFKPLSTLFNNIQSQRVQRFGGDLACGGNGEILLLLT